MSEPQTIEILPDGADPVRRLLTLGEPDSLDLDKWPDYPAMLGLGPEHVPALIALAEDTALHRMEPDQPESWAPTHAWRTLGQLRAEAAAEPLLRLYLHDADEDDVPGALDDLPDVLAMIGAPALPAIATVLAGSDVSQAAMDTAVGLLPAIAEKHPDLRETCIGMLNPILAPDSPYNSETIGWTVSALADLKAVESIEAIRDAFRRGAVDDSFRGDVEDVEIILGLREHRDTPDPFLESPYSFDSGMDWDDPDWDGDGPEEPIRTEPKIGRNAPCPCGSGKKYKKCCIDA